MTKMTGCSLREAEAKFKLKQGGLKLVVMVRPRL